MHLPIGPVVERPPHHGAGLQVDAEVAGDACIFGEEPLDDVAFIAEQDHEFLEALLRINLHDVPQDRPAADFDHRLRYRHRLFGEAGAASTGQYRNFHRSQSR